MYHKIKNKQWSTNTFSKAKQSGEAVKLMEGFTGAGVFPTTCGTINPPTATSFPSVCDKLKFLLCNDNFEKLRRLLGGITIPQASSQASQVSFNIYTRSGSIFTQNGNINTGSGNIITSGGNIITGTLATSVNDGGDIITNGGSIITRGGNIITGSTVDSTGGGTIYTNRGDIVTSGGNITTGSSLNSTSGGGYINTARGEIKTNGGNIITGSIITGSITAPNINVTNLYAIGTDMNTRKIEVHDHTQFDVPKVLRIHYIENNNPIMGEIIFRAENGTSMFRIRGGTVYYQLWVHKTGEDAVEDYKGKYLKYASADLDSQSG
jgi:hypothetical protein